MFEKRAKQPIINWLINNNVIQLLYTENSSRSTLYSLTFYIRVKEMVHKVHDMVIVKYVVYSRMMLIAIYTLLIILSNS